MAAAVTMRAMSFWGLVRSRRRRISIFWPSQKSWRFLSMPIFLRSATRMGTTPSGQLGGVSAVMAGV